MIYSYGGSLQGTSHVRRGIPCQDANKTEKLENGTVIAAIADGVGSCEYSDAASALAVETAVRVCADGICEDPGCDFESLIERAFTQAELDIYKLALSNEHPVSEYDTTLSLVIYDGGKVTYGHSGDGGVIGLTQDGDYIAITSPQKSEGIYVVPLRAGVDSWAIGAADGRFAGVLLATDGVYDTFFPYLLKGQPVEIYIPLIQFFMDNRVLGVSGDTIGSIQEARMGFLESEACAAITDDKTVVVLVDGDIVPEAKEDAFYGEPDWDALQLEWDKKAYPQLYDS